MWWESVRLCVLQNEMFHWFRSKWKQEMPVWEFPFSVCLSCPSPFCLSFPFSSFSSPYKAKTRFLLIAITQQSRFVVGEHGAWLNTSTSRSVGELWFSCALRGSRGAEVRPLQLLTTAATSAVRRTNEYTARKAIINQTGHERFTSTASETAPQ